MRRIETEGAAVVQRRRIAAQAFGAFGRVAFVVVELRDEAFEGAPEGDDIGAGVGVGIVGLEAEAFRDAGEFAGAQIDQQVELAVRVGHGGGDLRAVGGIGSEAFELVVVGEHGEAEFDDIAQVHLQRLYRAEAPEDMQDDLPERFSWVGEYDGSRGRRFWRALSSKLSR